WALNWWLSLPVSLVVCR
ncbi:branched-chain amino acid transport system / permease component family protein, partial [Vibrio parahaemolyticus VPTS-2010]